MHAVSSSTAAASDAGVVELREGHARDERLEGGALRRLPGHRERAERAAVERVLERDDARLAGRLARVLDRRLDGLRAGVAEERVRAAEALGEQLGEARHRLRPVEVRDVPEPVELLVRGGERCGMAVAEPDDGDAADEIEVAAAVDVLEPRAVAAHERHVGARVRLEQRRAGASRCVTRPPPPSRRSPRGRRAAPP